MATALATPLNELAKSSVRGDREALRALMERVQGPVYRLALRMLGRRADAEDAAQEILVQVLTRLSTFEGRSDLMTWVYTIASRHLLQTNRRGWEVRAIPAEEMAELIDSGLRFAGPSAVQPSEAPLLEKELQRICAHGMLMCLSRGERLAFLLADVLGATDRVGAQICDIAPAAFRQRLARARATMRPLLAERCGLVDEKLPCRCSAQVAPVVAAGGLRVDRISPDEPLEKDAELARADEQLGYLRKLGHLFGRDPPVAAPRAVWDGLARACPELLG